MPPGEACPDRDKDGVRGGILPGSGDIQKNILIIRLVPSSLGSGVTHLQTSSYAGERQFFIDNLLVRIYSIIEMMSSTGLAPWEFEYTGEFNAMFRPASFYHFPQELAPVQENARK